MGTLKLIVDGNGKDTFGLLLSDDVLTQSTVNIARLWHLPNRQEGTTGSGPTFAAHNIITKLDTIQANPTMNPENELFNLLPAFAAKHTATVIPVVPAEPSHPLTSRAI